MAENGMSDISLGLASLKVAGSLLLLLGLILLGFYLLKRFGPRAGLRFAAGEQIKLLGQVSLGPKRQLVLVRFLNRLLLLGVTETNIQLLAEADDEQKNQNHFQSQLQKAAQPESGASGPFDSEPGAAKRG
ncbi:MAG: flagellar biosynthetic protein FliO [Desulfohalobiaceae bacterium]